MTMMQKRSKIILAAIAAVLLLTACGFWAYMNAEVSLDKILPREQWIDMGIIAVVFEDGQMQHKAYMEEMNVSGQLRQALYSGKAERKRPFEDMRADFIWLVIWTGDHDMWNLSLGENGLLSITAPDLHTYYFENCQELYWQVQEIVGGLPLAE